jgi:hypothetical protein
MTRKSGAAFGLRRSFVRVIYFLRLPRKAWGGHFEISEAIHFPFDNRIGDAISINLRSRTGGE